MKHKEYYLMRTSNAIDSAPSSLARGRLRDINVIHRLAMEIRMQKILKNKCMVRR